MPPDPFSNPGRFRWLRRCAAGFVLVFFLPLVASAVTHSETGSSWRDARQDPTGQAPDPSTTREAVLQVYGARAFSWRGIFGIHTWFALKPADADEYTRLEVIGWHLRHEGTAFSLSTGGPDNYWFGSRPWIIAEYCGDVAQELIPKVMAAAKTYPFAQVYRVWPGPNSNSFTAYIARQVPELRLHLPPHAVGKDYLDDGVVAPAPSGSGYQFNLFGLFGIVAALEEGLEINVFGLVFGIDFKGPGVKLPGLGLIGRDRGPRC